MLSFVFSGSLGNYCQTLIGEFYEIPDTRKEQLDHLAKYLASVLRENGEVSVVFICVHNSRRSQMGQIWLSIASAWYDLKGIHAFSGGTEATAFHDRAVEALRRAGIPLERFRRITDDNDDSNPFYFIEGLHSTEKEQLLFSKKIDQAPNPQHGFVAIMVCQESEAACPMALGAVMRFSLPYNDPKNFDDTPLELAAYDERVRQIGREMFYLIHQVKEKTYADESFFCEFLPKTGWKKVTDRQYY